MAVIFKGQAWHLWDFNGILIQEVLWYPGSCLRGKFHFIMGSKGGSDFSAKCDFFFLQNVTFFFFCQKWLFCQIFPDAYYWEKIAWNLLMEQHGKDLVGKKNGRPQKKKKKDTKKLDQQNQVQQNNLVTLWTRRSGAARRSRRKNQWRMKDNLSGFSSIGRQGPTLAEAVYRKSSPACSWKNPSRTRPVSLTKVGV